MFPKRPADAHKGSLGKILLISGSYGMAGAACLNILGARTLGTQYILAAVPEEIYPICAVRHITPVFLPYKAGDAVHTISENLKDVRAICFGSGAVHNQDKRTILDYLLRSWQKPLVLDAEALRMLSEKKDQLSVRLKDVRRSIIITPHIGEFSALSGISVYKIKEDPAGSALGFSADNDVITVLKGPNTAVISPDGRVYENDSGNQALAQAGSGDILTGMITAMLSFIDDPFDAACLAVFMHGYIADEGIMTHSIQAFPLEKYPAIMDTIFKRNGF